MIPNPLHPALVHFPIVLALLLPLVVAGALVAMKRGAPARTAWLAPVVLAFLLLVSTWVTVETGEEQEEMVEDVVSEQALETHEEAAKLFLALSVVSALVVGAGVAPGRAGRIGRGAGAAMSLVLAVAVFTVGRSGGELVYTHGAAQAYVASATRADGREALPARRERDHDEDEEERH